MTEPNNVTEPNNTTPDQDPASDGGNDWEAKLAKAEKLRLDAQKRESNLKQKLADLEQAQADAAAKKRQEELEAKGNYDQLLLEAKAEYDKLIAAKDAEILKRDLKDKLRSKALSGDDIFFDWAVDRFAGTADNIEEYITSLQESDKTARFFQEPQTAPSPSGHTPPPAASARGAGGNLSLEARLKSDDSKVKMDALNEQLRGQLSGTLPIAPVVVKK